MTRNNLPTISDALSDFLDQIASSKQSNTVQSYGVALRRFQQFLADSQNLFGDTPVIELDVDHAIEYSKSLHGLAPATIRNYLAALAQFYRYLFANGLTNIATADSERLFVALRQIRPQSTSLPHVPSDEVIDALIQVASDELQQPQRQRSSGDKDRAQLQRLRNIALLQALKSSGMRLGETISLQCGDLDYRNKSANVTGEGRKHRIVYFDDGAWRALLEYLQAQQDGKHTRALSHLPVFARHDRRAGNQILPITRQGVEQIFSKLAERAMMDPKPTPQWFRHWFAAHILDRTQDLATLQDILGHESAVTTRVYAKTSTAKQMRDVHKTAFGDRSKDVAQELAEIISKGENHFVEFKVAARWNPHTKKKDDSLKDNIVQAVAAFMNRDGGTIIIGVKDDGDVVGLKEDYAAADPQKCNRDGYEMFLRNVIGDSLGADSALFYKVLFLQINEMEVCELRIEPASMPIYLDGDLYIREGNKKRKLKAKDAISFHKERWSDSS